MVRARMVRICVLLLAIMASTVAVDQAQVAARITAMPKDHPRLFMDKAGEAALRKRLATDPLLTALHQAALREADKVLASKPVVRELIGKRLLDKARTCLGRLTHLSYAWRLTGEAKYLDRAKAEMLAVAEFKDWNPDHFLDVAEFTAGMAVAYDWLHAGLDEATRATVRGAIMDKGVKPSSGKGQWWITGNNNWSQVCHAGMVMGVLAIHDADPSQTAAIVARAVDGVPRSMAEFGPDGAYPEGPGYWSYGTTFNVLLIAALESVLGSDFGLCGIPGFLPTADYFQHVVGPTGQSFNYVDCGADGLGIQPAMFWFAARRKEPGLLFTELGQLAEQMARGGGRSVYSSDRTFPLIMAWAPALPAQRTTPAALSWTGGGASPVGLHRSAWTPDATYVAIKGGSPSVNHGHMDVGSFVIDADGLRWAEDLGAQSYFSLESKKIDLWNNKQESQRWSVFRIGSFSHNILTVDGQQQRVQGKAPIIKGKPGWTVIDATAVYQGQLSRALRGAVLLADRSVIIQDEIAATKAVTVRWAMVTRAEVKVAGAGQAALAQKGKAMAFRVIEPADAEVKTWSTDPPASYDAANPGTRLIGFEVKLPAGASQRLVVHLSPGKEGAPPAVKPLAAW